LVCHRHNIANDDEQRLLAATLEPSRAASDEPFNPPSWTTISPREAPLTRGPDLFSFLFKLVGKCNGCEANSSFFDQVPSRGQRDLHESVSTRVIAGYWMEKTCGGHVLVMRMQMMEAF
jgi:hypothetical protein